MERISAFFHLSAALVHPVLIIAGLALFAALIGYAVYQSVRIRSLYRENNQLRSRADLRRQLDRLRSQALLDVFTLSFPGLAEQLDYVLNRALEITGSSRGRIYLCNNSSNRLSLISCTENGAPDAHPRSSCLLLISDRKVFCRMSFGRKAR